VSAAGLGAPRVLTFVLRYDHDIELTVAAIRSGRPVGVEDLYASSGRGLAIAGLVLSGIWAVAIGIGVAVTIMNEADRDTAGEITREGSVPATSVQVGDCLKNLEENPTIGTLPGVPCSEPHEGEVVGLFDLPMGDYPDQASMERQANTRCSELLQAYSASAFDDRSVGLFYLYPLKAAWPDDREVVCVAAAIDGPVTGSYADR
jgi:Septum formation